MAPALIIGVIAIVAACASGCLKFFSALHAEEQGLNWPRI
ncbi:hypothetical protein NSDW_11930 [Novosphingobium olei]|nr:hypothetical protein NSDW_11930 [Novosphingobium olei]